MKGDATIRCSNVSRYEDLGVRKDLAESRTDAESGVEYLEFHDVSFSIQKHAGATTVKCPGCGLDIPLAVTYTSILKRILATVWPLHLLVRQR